ncbi:sodium:calcium antiporter [Heliorestis acidaminivorans]|uniref:sodium:calcium antiporter n=1 Tax=Heliorestis acidaminivorans TaxID=553427 RepID=UPI001FAADD76|nr:sodium:calcium antiporter [Heliorestis acidaminivorans]
MLLAIVLFLISIALILLAAELFTNAVEWMGAIYGWTRGVVGSLVAAVGTAMPETMIPLVAIFVYGGSEGIEVGIGAILGAPFMLASIALFLVGFAAIILRKNWKAQLNVNVKVFQRDLTFFLAVFSLLLMPLLFQGHLISGYESYLAILLLGTYALYVFMTVRGGEGGVLEPEKGLYLQRRRSRPSIKAVFVQLTIALSLMAFGANLFVSTIESIAHIMSWPALIVAFILAPLATELPEKVNSLIWVYKGEDTLALGNITGAMVFQSTCIPAIALLAGVWKLNELAIFAASLTLLSAVVILTLFLLNRKVLQAPILLTGGFVYFIFALWVFEMAI